jgi:DNA replication protein DnaC
MTQQASDTFGWLVGAYNSDMPLAEKTFENFQAERQLEAFDAAREFALEPRGVLVLCGSYGTGKTHLLAAICNELRLREVSSRFVMAPKLHRAIAECYQHDSDTGTIFRKAIMTPLLVIDDVGASKWTESRQETYEMIIEERTKHGRPIALSTNHLDKLADFVGGRACSRLSIGQIAVEMVGADFRMEM